MNVDGLVWAAQRLVDSWREEQMANCAKLGMPRDDWILLTNIWQKALISELAKHKGEDDPVADITDRGGR